MNEVKLEDIQLTKPQILVDAGLAENHDDAIQKLREFAISLSSSSQPIIVDFLFRNKSVAGMCEYVSVLLEESISIELSSLLIS